MKIDFFDKAMWARITRIAVAASMVTGSASSGARADNQSIIVGADFLALPEDTVVECFDPVANDSETNVEPLTLVSIGAASHGLATTSGNCVRYAPAADFHGSDEVAYQVTNGSEFRSGTIQITVTPVNDAPTAFDRNVTVAADAVASIDVTGTDSDGDGLTVGFLSQPTRGAISGSYPTLTYTPSSEGTDTIAYRLFDGTVLSAVATITITVTNSGQPGPQVTPTPTPTPVSNPQGPQTVYENTDLLLDGSASSGGGLTYLWQQTGGPAVTLPAGSQWTDMRLLIRAPDLLPDANPIAETVTFDLIVTNGSGSDTEPISVLVRPGAPQNVLTVTPNVSSDLAGDEAAFNSETGVTAGNHAPTMTFAGPMEVEVNVALEEVAGIDDQDGNPFFVTVTGASHGTATYLAGTDKIRYVPDTDYTGTDQFVVNVRDNYFARSLYVVDVNVTDPLAAGAAANGAPDAPDAAANCNFNATKNIQLMATDPDDDPLTYALLAIHGGTLNGLPLGATVVQPTVTFTPETGFSGRAEFVYRVTDTSGASDIGKVTVTVLDPNVNTDLYFRHPRRADSMRLATSSGYGANGFVFDSTQIPDGDYNAATEPNRFYVMARAANGGVAIAAGDTRVDNTPPTAQYVPNTPADGSFVSGVIPVRATANDNFANNVNSVLFKDPRDSTVKAMDQQDGEYSLVYPTYEGYDTTRLTDGLRRIQINAVDRAGNRSANVVRDYLVDNTPPNTLTISIPSMTADRLVRRMVTINLSASDPASGTLAAGSGMKSLDLALVVSAQNQPNVHHADAAATSYSWNTSGWPDGTYGLRLDARDNRNNLATKLEQNVIVDNSAPIVNITAPAEGAALSGLVTVSATATDANGIASVKLLVDGNLKQTLTAAPFNFSLNTATLASGDHVISVVAQDKAGNTGSRTVNVTTSNADNTAPTVSVTAPAASSLLRGSVDITANASDNVGVTKVEFYVDGAKKGEDASSPYSYSWNSATSANGARLITAKAFDAAGNSQTSSAVSVTVDNAAPSISFDAPAASAFLKGIVAVEAAAADNLAVASVEFLVDGVSQGTDNSSPYSFSWNTASFGEGARILRVVATDTAGNTAGVNRSVTIDRTNPSVSVTSPSNGDNVSGTVAIAASVTESNLERVDFLVDDVVIGTDTSAPFSQNWDASQATNGAHSVSVRATDRAGNEGQASISVTVSGGEDLSVTISNPANGSSVSGTINVAANPSTTGGNTVTLVELFVDGVLMGTDTAAPFSIPLNTGTLSNGSHDIRIVVHDDGGNQAEQTITVSVDNAAPTAAITSPADGAAVRGAITVTTTVSDNALIQRVELLVDGSVRQTLTSAPYNFSLNTTLISNGTRTLQARAWDLAGNSGASAAVNITVDNEAPVVAVNEPGAGERVRGTMTIRGAASDNRGVDLIEYYVDGVLLIGSTTPPYEAVWDTTTASEGSHTVRIAARDAVGNEGSATQNVIVENTDVTAPTVSLTNPRNGARLSGTVTVRASASDAFGVERVEFWLDGAIKGTDTSAPYTMAWDTVTAVNGAHVLQAKAFDAAGNSADSAMVSVSVDNQRPDITSATPADGSSVSGSQTLQMSFADNMEVRHGQISVDGTPVAYRDDLTGISGTLGYQLNTLNLADGLHTLAFDVTDAAGNARSMSRMITVLNAGGSEPAPTFRIINAPNGAYLAGAQDLEIEILSGTATSVIFRIDGVVNNGAQRSGNPNRWFYRWLTGGVADGTHTIEYVAANASDFSTQSALVTTINTPPTIAFEAPAENAVVWGVKNINIRASAGVFPVNNVLLRIGTEDVFQSQGNTPVTNTLYVYGFDAESVNGSGDRRFPDGDYTLYAEVTDAAGNRRSTTRPIRIDTSNIPVSNAVIHEHPANGSMPVSDEDNQIYVTFENADPDLTAVTPSSLQAFIADDDGVFRPLTGGTVGFSGGALRLSGITIPKNSRVKVVLRFQDTLGNAIRLVWFFTRPIPKRTGGEAAWKGVSLKFPPNGLPEDLYINFEKVSDGGAAQQADLSSSNINRGQQTIFGPVDVWGTAAGKTERIVDLIAPASIRYELPPGQDDLEKRGTVLDFQRFDTSIWRTLSAGAGLSSGAAPISRTVSASLGRLGILRVAAAPAPAPGVNDFFNFPNPFSPDEGGTDFHYMLGADSDVTIVIYDLLGNLVRKIDISAGSQGGRYGQNFHKWNGRNGEGETVASGGYVVHILAEGRDGSKTRAKYKVGVVR